MYIPSKRSQRCPSKPAKTLSHPRPSPTRRRKSWTKLLPPLFSRSIQRRRHTQHSSNDDLPSALDLHENGTPEDVEKKKRATSTARLFVEILTQKAPPSNRNLSLYELASQRRLKAQNKRRRDRVLNEFLFVRDVWTVGYIFTHEYTIKIFFRFDEQRSDETLLF